MISLKVLSHLLAGTYNLIPKALRDNSFTGIRGPVGVVGSGSRTFQTTLSRSSWGTNATHLARDRYPACGGQSFSELRTSEWQMTVVAFLLLCLWNPWHDLWPRCQVLALGQNIYSAVVFVHQHRSFRLENYHQEKREEKAPYGHFTGVCILSKGVVSMN